MKGILVLSEAIVPILVFYVISTGLWNKQQIYSDFLEGAKDGIKTVVEIMPTLIGLMVAVGILRASGFLEDLGQLLGNLMGKNQALSDLIPLSLVKMFSSSASTGLLLDIYKEHGTDSFVGLCASLIMSSTETIFYTMSVYFMTVGVKKTRYTLAGALFSTLVGMGASILLARFL